MLLGFSLLPIRSQQPIFSGFLCRWTMHCPLLASQAPGARRWVRRVLELDAIGLLQLQVAGTTCRTWPSVLQLFGADKSWDDLVRWQSKQEGILRLESGNYWEVRWFTWTGFSIFTVTGFFQQIPGSGVRANHNIYIYIINGQQKTWLLVNKATHWGPWDSPNWSPQPWHLRPVRCKAPPALVLQDSLPSIHRFRHQTQASGGHNAPKKEPKPWELHGILWDFMRFNKDLMWFT